MTASEWVAAYGKAWNERDADLAASIFAEQSAYYDHLLQPPHVGREGVAEYWRTVTASQSEVNCLMGEPIVMGNRFAVEFWTRMKADGADATVAGCMLMRLDGEGLCEELREYWFFEMGTHVPPEIWGK